MNWLKNAVAVVALATSTTACAGPMQSQELELKQIVDIPGAKKEEIYERSRMWFADTFRSAQNVIQCESKETGTIIGKGTAASTTMGAPVTIRFKVTTEAKDNKARVTISEQVLLTNWGERDIYPYEWDSFKSALTEIMRDYQTKISNQVGNDNW